MKPAPTGSPKLFVIGVITIAALFLAGFLIFDSEVETAASTEPVVDAASDSVGAEAPNPRITVIEPKRYSGSLVYEPGFQEVEIEAGEKIVEVTFSVRNEGGEPVKIREIISGCECLSVEIDKDPIPPAAMATITGVFEVEKLRGRSERKITVISEQHPRPVFLTTRIKTDPIYELKEAMTNWEIGSDPIPKIVEFRVLREKPIRVLSAESKRKEVSCELIVIEEGRAYDLKLTPESTDSSLLGIVRIETDCELENYARPLAYFSIQ
ncbi:MAG: DUF1573 domain-containing protein [Verrucomicrobiota bacterium]